MTLTINHWVHVQYSSVVSMTTIYVSQAIHCIHALSYILITVTVCKTMKLCTNTLYHCYCCHGNNEYTYSVGLSLLNGYLVLSLKHVNICGQHPALSQSMIYHKVHLNNNMDHSPDCLLDEHTTSLKIFQCPEGIKDAWLPLIKNPQSANNPVTNPYNVINTKLWNPFSQVLVPPSTRHNSLTDNVPDILGEHAYQCCSHPNHRRWQYRDYIIYLYSVKHSTVSNTKYAMPSLSYLLSFILSLYPSFFNWKNCLFSNIQSTTVLCDTHRYSAIIAFLHLCPQSVGVKECNNLQTCVISVSENGCVHFSLQCTACVICGFT